jgi:hypothetical protein
VRNERSYVENPIVNYFQLYRLPIIRDYCYPYGEFFSKGSTKYITYGMDAEWQDYETMRLNVIRFCHSRDIDLYSIGDIYRWGDVRNVERNDELYWMTKCGRYDYIVSVRYFKINTITKISSLADGHCLIGDKSEIFIDKTAQQDDSAEASTIAVPPSDPPGSPR